jgi:hypothetical protein
MAYADLLEVRLHPTDPKRRVLRIIDAKSSDKAAHRFQIAVYSIYLKDILIREKISDLEVHTQGGIWVKDESEIRWFDVRHFETLVSNFFRKSLQQQLAVRLLDADWYLAPRCEGYPLPLPTRILLFT